MKKKGRGIRIIGINSNEMYEILKVGKSRREDTDEEKVGKDKTERNKYCLQEKQKRKQ